MRRAALAGSTALAAVLLLAGCARHATREASLSSPVPEAFRGAAATDSTAPIGRWWEAFGDPNLGDLVQEALAANLDIRQAFARLAQVRALTGTAAASRRPSLGLRAQASADHQPGISGSHTGLNARLAVEAGYEIDLWDRLASREKAALLDEEATRLDIESLYLGLSARVADLYYLAVEQRAQLLLTDATIAASQEILDRVEGRYRQGLVPALDVYQARQNLSLARSRRPQYEAALSRSGNALAVLLGRYPGAESFGDLAVLPEAPEAWPAGLPSELLARRPDVRGAARRLAASDARIAAAVADRFPSFNLAAGYGLARTSLAAGDVTGVFWSFLAGLVQPVLDGGRRKAEVARTEAVFAEGLARYRQSVLRAFQEAEDALAANATTEARLALLAERAESASAALRLATDRYLQGLSDYLPVLTAQGIHFEARSQLLSGRRQLLSDRVGLALALGGEWMEEHVASRTGTDGEPEDNRRTQK